MGVRRLSKAAKERWRKRKLAAMEASHSEQADCPNHSLVTTDNDPSRHSQTGALSSKRKTPKANSIAVRRSNRLKSFGSFGKSQGREAIQHIDLTDCNGDTELHVEPVSRKHIRDVTRSEMNVNNLVQTRGRRPFAMVATLKDLSYKILYIDSQKKIKVLEEESYRQAQELQYMLGKVKIYENMIGIMKDMASFSNMGKPTGAATNLSRGTVEHHPDDPTLDSASAPKPSPVKRTNTVKG